MSPNIKVTTYDPIGNIIRTDVISTDKSWSLYYGHPTLIGRIRIESVEDTVKPRTWERGM